MTQVGAGWVMVNCTGETLTESASGGIAAWVLGVVRAAQAGGATVPVITKRHQSHPVAWPAVLELDYPWPAFPGHSRLDSALRRRLAYVHPWQPLWNRRVLAGLRRVAPEPCNVLLHNDPELACVVARALPEHTVWHLLHNTNPLAPRWRARFADDVRPLAVSRFIAGWCEQHFDLAPGSVPTVLSGVDSELFRPGDKGEVPVVTYAGLFNERKAPDLLLAACELVASSPQAPRFAVALYGATHYGPPEVDSYGRDLQKAVERLRALGVAVDLPGFLSRTDLSRGLAGSSVHVVPSRCDEAFGLAALEGMAAGAATVVSDRGGLPEVAGDGAEVVPADDPVALAAHLAVLLSDRSRRSELAARGRRRAEVLSWARTWQGLRSTDLLAVSS